MLKASTVAAAGLAVTAACGLMSPAASAAPAAATSSGAATPPKGCRVGATVTPNAYPKGTTWEEAMANFNSDVGRDFEVAKRYFRGPKTWPTTAKDVGTIIKSLLDPATGQQKCRGLLCFKPAVNGTDTTALSTALKAIKQAGITDAKVTLYQEQGLEEKLTAQQFQDVYARYYDSVHPYYPLFVDFSGRAQSTWASYRPAAHYLDGYAVDLYAHSWAREKVGVEPIADWADGAGQEFGIWEMGNQNATPDEVQAYFAYLTQLQQGRLQAGQLVGDMAWFNGPQQHNFNEISGTDLCALYVQDRKLLRTFFDAFNGVQTPTS
jgi:hypothetical protein